jgi:hypothetical protein
VQPLTQYGYCGYNIWQVLMSIGGPGGEGCIHFSCITFWVSSERGKEDKDVL